MYGIKTIDVAAQENLNALCAALGAALASELGWQTDNEIEGRSHVLNPDGKTEFQFFVSSSRVYCSAAGTGLMATTTYCYGVDYSASYTYKLDVVKTANTTAICARRTGDAFKYLALIAANENGGSAAISNGGSYYQSAAGTDDFQKISMPINDQNGAAVSLVKFPDIFGGCMFKDLYLVVSCTYKAEDLVVDVDGTKYRLLGYSGSYGGFALEVKDGD